MTKADKIAFLTVLKKKINRDTEFSCIYPRDEDIDYFIWVKTKDARLGNFACHYEVIFYSRGEGLNPNVPFVEVHFENPKTLRAFQGITLPGELKYDSWGNRDDSRIIYKDADEGRNLTDEEVIGRLMELEKHIGQQLRDAFRRQIPKSPKKTVQSKPEFPRDPDIAKKAMELACGKCEIDAGHESFIGKTGDKYMEAHHLIPLSGQDDFENSLDQEQNIVCLCPKCHKEIHHGMNRLRLVKKLWEQRDSDLEAAGIGITMPELEKYYP